MAIEIVSFPMKKWWIFPVRYVKLPEGNDDKNGFPIKHDFP